MKTFALFLALCTAAVSGCSPSDKAHCSTGWTLCDGRCRALISDEANCGACGNACAAGESCVAGNCAADCTRQLHNPLQDAWGNTWDGNERPAADLVSARAACEAIGGRLPSLSELDRVSAPKTGAVADVYWTNVIRALTPADDARTMAIKLSDGTTSTLANGTASHYRCVCPAPAPASFSAGACQAAPGETCFTFAGDPTLAFDAQDRPKATKAAAIWDCALSGGQLAPAERLASAVLAGLPNGSSTPLHTADQLTASQEARLSWATESWTAVGNLDIGAPTDLAPFRCVGPRSATLASATSLGGGVIAPATHAVVDGTDNATSLPYADALGACVAAGGHLPAAAELASAAMQGVPRTETGLLWAGDEIEDGTAGRFGWTGTAEWPGVTSATVAGIPFASPATIGGSTKATALSYRCLYPAVDTSYAGPAASDCNGGCAILESTAGRTGASARTWIDGSDRAPSNFETATAFCATLGGRLASARDLIEAIRNGLPGSAGVTPAQVLTADLAAAWEMVAAGYYTQSCAWTYCTTFPYICYQCTNVWHPPVYDWRPGHYVLPQWSGNANPTYDDSAGRAVSIGTAGPFRCVWTNEIR